MKILLDTIKNDLSQNEIIEICDALADQAVALRLKGLNKRSEGLFDLIVKLETILDDKANDGGL